MISIVVPAYNEEKSISACLDSLVNQKTLYEFEIIVVDNNSTDRTGAIAKRYIEKSPIRIIFEKKKGRGAARQAGFKVARGDIILSTDADAIVPENWMDYITSYFNDPTVIAVTGPCKINDCSYIRNTIFNFLQPKLMISYRIIFQHYWLSGFNFAIRKEIYEEAGGFNPALNVQEDTELSFRVRKLGKIKFARRLLVIASGRRFKNGLIQGLGSYLKTYIDYFVFKKVNTTLSDTR